MSKRRRPMHARITMAPRVKERPRLGRRRRAYTPQRTLDGEDEIRRQWKRQVRRKPLEGPVAMEIHFDKGGIDISVRSLEDAPNLLRGDLDNYGKLAMDALNGVAYLDDRQVVRLVLSKDGHRARPTPEEGV